MNWISKILFKLIDFIDKHTTKESDEKLIKSFNCSDMNSLSNIEVLSDTGYVPISSIHLTKRFEIYRLETEDGLVLHCADNHIVFDNFMNEVYIKDLRKGNFIRTINGLSKIKSVHILNSSVCMCDITVDSNEHRFYSSGILSHNTTTSAIFMLHYICFNFDKNALVLGQKRATAIEILDKCKKIYIELPFFLRAGIYKWNEGEIVLDNGCRIMAEATTINSGISYTFHCVLSDEFAHIPPNIIDKFYNNLFPTITAGKARFMITSTQNGYNLFYTLYNNAVNGENEYKPFKIDWYQVPEWNPETKTWEKRDEKWRQAQIANYGSEEAFNAQFGTDFDISSDTLIATRILNDKKREVKQFIAKDLPGVPLSDKYFWDPDYDPIESLKNDYIVITCDIAEGIGHDYTVFLINRMIEPGSQKTECVGFFKSNVDERSNCALSLQLFTCLYCNINNFLISIEWNTYGELFLKNLYENTDRHEIISKSFDPLNIVKYYNETGSRYVCGIKITAGNKTPHCLLFKNSYEKNLVINNSAQFMIELEKFTNTGNNTFKASFGHDDMVMSQVQLEFVKETLQYKLLRSEFDSKVKIEEDSVYYNPYGTILQTSNNTIFDFENDINVNNDRKRVK